MSPYRVPPVVIHLKSGEDSSSDEEVDWEPTGSLHNTATEKTGQKKGGVIPEGLDMFLREMKQQTASTAKVG